MSYTVANTNSDHSGAGRKAPAPILGGENSDYSPNVRRYHERDSNRSLRIVERELRADIVEMLSKTELKLTGMSFHHVSPQLKTCLRAAKFNEVNGVGFTILEFENHPRLFAHSICDLRDTYSRLEGRVYSLRRIYQTLLKEGVAGLDHIPTPEGVTKTYESDTPYKIANYIIKNYIRRPEKVDVGVSPLEFVNEEEARIKASSILCEKFNLDPNTLQYYSVNIRKYSNKFFHGLNGTVPWIRSLNNPHVEVSSRGGYVIMGIVGIDKDTSEKNVFVTLSSCSPEDNFNRDYGRRQCLLNIEKQRYDVYSFSQELGMTISDALIQLASHYGLTVNVDISENVLKGLQPKV